MTPARRPGPVLLVGALVAVAVLMAALAGPWQLGHRRMSGGGVRRSRSRRRPGAAAEPTTRRRATQMAVAQGRWILLVLLIALGLVTVVLLAFLLRKLAQSCASAGSRRDVDEADPGHRARG